jgi:hypothetical protein
MKQRREWNKMILEYLRLFFILWALHALADFALQSDVMAKGKNRNLEGENKKRLVKEGIVKEGEFKKCWFWWLSGHALIHGGLIALVFPAFWWLGVMETFAHFLIDFIKCDKKTNPHQDQFLHVSLRLFYALIIVIGM